MSKLLSKSDLVNGQNISQVLQDAWLNIYVDEKKLFNPLMSVPDGMEDTPEIYFTWLMSRPEYFYFACDQLFNIKLLPFQCAILCEMWNRKFPMLIGSRGLGKSFLLGIYSLLRALLMKNRKIVICGAAFRQSKVIFNYIESIWNNSPLLRDIANSASMGGKCGPSHQSDMYVFDIGGSSIKALPIGDGQKIRGQRANDILSDEFASINIDIFENVIAGFAAVSAAPAENVKDIATRKMAELLGVEMEDQDSADRISKENQIVISGTAYYAFNHFAKYWEKWKSFIMSKGDPEKLSHIFPDGIPPDFNWKDYSVIRMPVDLLPHGFMDAAQLARSKATIHSGLYQMEFGAVHTSDSQGFFKRSVIEGCVANDKNQIIHDGNIITYGPTICGQKGKTYVMGVDPAAEVDNFSIVIIEMYESHRRVVYCWTTNKAKHQEDISNGFTNDNDYYSYCAKKIRDLSRKFNIVRIAIDGQGGGKQIIELLHNKILAQPGDKIYWPIIVPGDAKQSDGEQGEHIIEEINFASYEWVKNANHGLRFDLESKNILFPMFDSISIAEAQLVDKSSGVIDSLEDCTLEIEELKDELSNIIVVQTASNNRERWDTPDSKEAANKVKRGRMRKDRYSALIMANASAKDYSVPVISLQSCIDGAGFANNGGVSIRGDIEPPKYIGADFIVRSLSELY